MNMKVDAAPRSGKIRPMHEQNFFAYQRRALQPLLTWGIGSSLVGSALLLFPGYPRHVGLQALSWGAIDLLLAAAGRRRALLQAEALVHGEIDEAEVHAEAERFQQILAFNAGLDLVYIAAGLAIAARWSERDDRRGLGHGIAVQGAFLLVFDALLARNVAQRFLE